MFGVPALNISICTGPFLDSSDFTFSEKDKTSNCLFSLIGG
jgi:hypothetical protein